MKNPHTITHIEIPAPDLQKAVDFYSTVFKWEIDHKPNEPYTYFIIIQGKAGGGFDAALQPAEKNCGFQIVIDVENIDQALNDIQTAGGSVTMAKTEIPNGHGYYACFTDPNNNHLQIHSRN